MWIQLYLPRANTVQIQTSFFHLEVHFNTVKIQNKPQEVQILSCTALCSTLQSLCMDCNSRKLSSPISSHGETQFVLPVCTPTVLDICQALNTCTFDVDLVIMTLRMGGK